MAQQLGRVSLHEVNRIWTLSRTTDTLGVPRRVKNNGNAPRSKKSGWGLLMMKFISPLFVRHTQASFGLAEDLRVEISCISR